MFIFSFERTAEVGINIYWESRTTLIDQLYGYRKAEEYHVSNKLDQSSAESKDTTITTKMLRDLFLFIAAGSIFCSAILLLELLHFRAKEISAI